MSFATTPVARIWNLLRLERKEITAVYFYAILNGLILLTLPLGVQSIINFVIGASMRASLVILITAVVLGTGLAGLLQIKQMKVIEKIQQKIFVRYSFAFAAHIPRLDLKKTDNYYLPELVNRFFDIPILQKGLSKILLDIPTATIQILLGILLLSLYHPAFILFGIVLLLLIWLILRFSGNRGLQTSIEKSNYKYAVASWLQETARVIRSIKLVKNNDLHLRKTDDNVTGYLDARNRHFSVLLFQYNVLVVFKMVITAATLIVGTILLINQSLNIGQFIAAEIVILLVISSVEKLILNLSSVYDVLTAVEKLDTLTDKPVENNGHLKMKKEQVGMKLEMNEMSFGYEEDKEVLHNVSFRAMAGEKICITGKDSAGKSTLLRLLAGAYTDFKGAYLIDDIPVGNYDLSTLRENMGVLLNLQDIFHGSIWENITLGSEYITLEKVKEYASKTGLQEFIATLPKGYETRLDPTGKKLPRNVIQKILLVRALAAEPRLLLLEDPWAHVEGTHRHDLMDLLKQLPHCTIVVVTNDPEFIGYCDRQIILENGKCIIS